MSGAVTTPEIKRAAQLAVAEIGLGSIGHAFKIPLTGQILSLNQLAFILNALNRDGLPKSSAFEISGIAAVLKSFSPAGSKLGPMVSIALQGFLFWLGNLLPFVGQFVGAALLCIWAFVQPALTLWAVYGSDLFQLVDFYLKKMSDDYAFIAASVFYALIGAVMLKIVLAEVMVFYSLKYRKEITLVPEGAAARFLKKPQMSSHGPVRGALREMLRPVFVLSFVLMLVFIWQQNTGAAQKIWLSLRPLGVAFIIFYILRSPWVAAKLFRYSEKSPRFARLYAKSRAALAFIDKA